MTRQSCAAGLRRRRNEFKFRGDMTQPPTQTAWHDARFIAVTGHRGVGNPLDHITRFIDEHFRMSDAPTTSGTREGYRDAASPSDDDLLLQMIGGESGDRILALWRGDRARHAVRCPRDRTSWSWVPTGKPPT